MQPWKTAPGNDETTNESIPENFSLDSHHSENTGKGIPPEMLKYVCKIRELNASVLKIEHVLVQKV